MEFLPKVVTGRRRDRQGVRHPNVFRAKLKALQIALGNFVQAAVATVARVVATVVVLQVVATVVVHTPGQVVGSSWGLGAELGSGLGSGLGLLAHRIPGRISWQEWRDLLNKTWRDTTDVHRRFQSFSGHLGSILGLYRQRSRHRKVR